MGLFDQAQFDFYNMTPEELWAARALRKRELRAYRGEALWLYLQAWAVHLPLTVGLVVFGFWAPMMFLGTDGFWRLMPGLAWGAVVIWLIDSNATLNEWLKSQYGAAKHYWELADMHADSIRLLDQLLKDPNAHQPRGH